VTAYWLTRCEGFRVSSGRRRGVVESVALDLETWQAAYLVVRYRGLGRPRIVVPGAVDAVVPAEERLVLRSRGRSDGGDTIGRIARRVLPVLSRAGSLARVAAVSASLAALVLVRRVLPALWRAGSALGRGARVAAVSAGLAALVLAQAAQAIVARGVAHLASRERAPGFEHRPARR
jgi:hypothetical protein